MAAAAAANSNFGIVKQAFESIEFFPFIWHRNPEALRRGPGKPDVCAGVAVRVQLSPYPRFRCASRSLEGRGGLVAVRPVMLDINPAEGQKWLSTRVRPVSIVNSGTIQYRRAYNWQEGECHGA